MKPVIQRFMKQLEIGEPSTLGALSVFPVFNRGGVATPYVVLEEALRQGTVEITEKATEAVPELLLTNKADVMVLITQGDELVGGKQNRIVNVSILVAPHSVITLPVACVEQARWRFVSDKFGLGEKAYGKLRREVHRHVSESLRTRGAPYADQAGVWSSVQQELAASEAASPTLAMHEAYDHRRERLVEFEATLPYVDDAAGIVAAIGGGIVCAEIFDRPATCRSTWERLVRSLALEAISVREGEGKPTPGDAGEFLESAAGATVDSFPSPGLGKDLRVSSARLSGSALVIGEAVVHCSLFGAGEQVAP